MSTPTIQQVRLNIDRDGRLSWTKDRLIGTSITILGRKGTGKSTTLAVLAEELLKERVPLVIVDPMAEHYALAQAFDIIVAGRTEQALVALDPAKAGALAEFSLTRSVPVVLSLPRYTTEERFTLLRCFFERLWTLAEDLRRPYFVLLEEAHTYLPQVGTTPVFSILADLFLLGRKYGLSTILATQRSQKIHKDTISQSEFYLLHRVTHPKDIEVYEDLVPLPAKEVRAMLSRLRKGSAIAVYEDETLPEDVPSDVVVQVQIRNQQTYHAGATPTFETVEPIVVRTLDAALVTELQARLSEAQPDESERERALLRQIAALQEERMRQEEQLNSLREASASQEAHIGELTRQVALLSAITVTLDGTTIPALELPTVLQLDTMRTYVAQATIAMERVVDHRNQPGTAPGSAAELGEPVVGTAQVAEPAPLALLFSEEKLLKRLREQVAALSRSEKALLVWLLEHDGTETSSQDLADSVGMDVRVTWTNKTRRLVRFPFIARWGTNRFWYQARFDAYARKHFAPGTQTESIALQLVQAAQVEWR